MLWSEDRTTATVIKQVGEAPFSVQGGLGEWLANVEAAEASLAQQWGSV